jgi:sugar transferase (PEP-CTERM system associated)
MIRLFSHYLRRQTLLQVLLDVGLVFAGIIGLDLLRGSSSSKSFEAAAAAHGLSLAACLLFINTASGLYQSPHSRSVNQTCARAALALLLALPLAYVIFSLLPSDLGNRDVMILGSMTCVFGVIVHRVYAAHARVPSRSGSRILIFGSGEAALLVGKTLRAADPKAQIVGYFPAPNEYHSVVASNEMLLGRHSLRDCATELRIDEIVVALTERRGGTMPLRDLLDCKVGGMKVSDMSTYFEKMLGQIRIDHLYAGWLVFGDGFQQDLYRTLAKRAFDVISALLLLVVMAPLALLTALAIALDSRGPVLYRQLRVGLDGQLFKVLKFRSMRVDAEVGGKPQWAALRDHRVTRVGAVIRRFRLDELPQILNVLKGDMSLVGPRPERPFFVEQLTGQIPYYAVRHSVKPGITGWAQVRYDYGATVEDSLEKLQYDLYYVKNHSLFLDLVIVLETIGVVLSGKGAR